MKDRQKQSEAGANQSQVQGEGDYRSARVYKKDIDEFITSHRKDIPDMAQDARKATESSEGDELKRAEEKGKAKARR